jgi:tripartite-type tricarboxylate transporter receptor subunit TctC
MLRKGTRWFAGGSLAILLGLFGSVSGSQAQDAYPSRAIQLVSGFAAGGTTDLVARMAAQYLGDKWGVPINVVNKPGGNTVPAQVEVYGSAPDGYTLYADNIGSTSMLQISVPTLPFNVLDRTFVCMISSNSMLIFVAPDSPIKNLQDAIDEAKKDPENFTWTGVGVAEVPMRQMLSAAGVDIAKTKSVVSSGSVSAAVLAAGGNVKVGIAAVGPSISPVQSGLIRPIAIASDKRSPTLPDVLTGAEAGFPNVKVASWIGISGPPGLPDEVIKKWNEGIAEMVKDPAVVDQLSKLASVVDYRESADFKAQVAGELDEFKQLWKSN